MIVGVWPAPGDRIKFPDRGGGTTRWIYGVAVYHPRNDATRVAIQVDHAQGNIRHELLRFRNRTRVEPA